MSKWCLIFLLLAPLAQAEHSVSVKALSEVVKTKTLTAPASVVSKNVSKISAEISAVIKQLNPLIAQRVKRGDILAKLDCRVYQALLSQQQALLSKLKQNLKYTRSQLERANNLKRDKNISEDLFEKRQTDQRSLQSDILAQQQLIKRHQLDVEKCTIVAPFDGVIEERFASLGELASPGTVLCILRQTDDLEVSAQIRAGQYLSDQDKIEFISSQRRYPLMIKRVSSVIDTRTRSREVRLVFVDKTADSGAAGRIAWNNQQHWLPAELVVRRNGKDGVFLWRNKRAHFLPLDNVIEGQDIAINLDLSSKVIVDGRHLINDGDPVNTQTEEQ